jgi:acetylornithine deacetylase/succinyl-diaminopimelate desuccinylase family protein
MSGIERENLMVASDELEDIEAATDTLFNNAVDFLAEMIRTPSVNPPGEYGEIHSLVTSTYEQYEWEVETVWAPEKLLNELGLDPQYPRPNVLAYATRGSGPLITLNAHMDTVPVDQKKWNYQPFGAEIDEERIYGRGARDSKGRIASYTFAIRALEEADLIPEDTTIVLAITADEETGGEAGPGYVLDTGALDPDYAIVEGSTNKIDYAAAGVLHLDITVTGKASHAGVDPDSGVNAMTGAARIVNALEDHASELETRMSYFSGVGHGTCTPATIEGGIKTNVVPPSCSFTVDRRVLPEEDINEVEQEFRRFVESVALPDGASVEVDVILAAIPFVSKQDGTLTRALKRNVDQITGGNITIGGTRGFTDARFFGEAGAETAKYGPGDDASNVHGPDENIALPQVRDAICAVAATLVDIDREG